MAHLTCDYSQKGKPDDVQHVGTKFINFRDHDFGSDGRHCFQWADVRTFEIPNLVADDRKLIDSMIRTVEYRDDYVGGGIDVNGTRHGPYWLSSLSPSSFDLIESSEATRVLDEWLRNCGTLPPPLASEIDTAVRAVLEEADSIYALRDLDDSATNDYGNLHTEFHELIVVNRRAKLLSVIVLTDD